MMKSQKCDIIRKKHAYLSVSAAMFCKQCLAYSYCTH